MIPRVIALLALSVLLAAPVCAGKRAATPDVVSDALAWAATDRDKAIRLLTQAAEDDPSVSAKALPLVHAYLAEQHRLAGHETDARVWFASARRSGAAAGDVGFAVLDRDLAALASIPEKDVPDTLNAERHLLLAWDARQRGDAARFRDHARAAVDYAEDDADVAARVDAQLAELEAVSEGEAAAPAPVAARGSLLERAEAALADGRADDARRLAERALGDLDAASEEALVARYVLRRIDAAPIDPKRIAVLLPLSGRFQAAGTQIKEALELGFRGAAGAKLVFIDTAGTEEGAVAALEKAVLQGGAIAVVGPLRTDSAPAVARAADALRVPLVNLAQVDGVAVDRDWVVQGTVTPRDQVRSLVEYAITERKMQRFAVFAPDNDYGRTAATAFVTEVTARGGTVRAPVYYDPDTTDYRDAASKLGADAKKVQGLFVPDGARRIPLVAGGLAYAEFPMGDFRPDPRAAPITLMGLSGWNDEGLSTRGGPYVRNSLFTDAFIEDQSTREFAGRYREALGRTPTALEALAFDVGRLVSTAAAAEATSREAFLGALVAAKPTGTVTGPLTIDGDSHDTAHKVRVLTLSRDGVRALR